VPCALSVNRKMLPTNNNYHLGLHPKKRSSRYNVYICIRIYIYICIYIYIYPSNPLNLTCGRFIRSNNKYPYSIEHTVCYTYISAWMRGCRADRWSELRRIRTWDCAVLYYTVYHLVQKYGDAGFLRPGVTSVPRRSVHRQTDHATFRPKRSIHPTNRLL
jgi:hypothetical protein